MTRRPRPARCSPSTTSRRPWTSSPSCSDATTASARCRPAARPRRPSGCSATSAFDLVLLDIAMPGLSGLELAQVLRQFRQPPAVVFVTAHAHHAVDAFDLRAVDYLLKPVHEDRLREAIDRVRDEPAGHDPDEQVAVELAGVTRFVRRSEVRYASAQGDYVRLHTATENPPRPDAPRRARATVGRGRLRPDPPQPPGLPRPRRRGPARWRTAHGRGRGHRAPGEPPTRAGRPQPGTPHPQRRGVSR